MALVRALFLHIILCLSTCTFAVTVIPLTLNLPKAYKSKVTHATSDYDLLIKLDPSLQRPNGSKEFIESSVYSRRCQRLLELNGVSCALSPGPDGKEFTDAVNNIYAAQDSFVRAATDASSKHPHLVFRPDDVWFTILTQLGFYMRKHKYEQIVRDLWDNWDGKEIPRNNMWLILVSGMDQWMNVVFRQRRKAKWLTDWVRPTFPTLANRSMGTGGVFGKEPALYALVLRPLLNRFVATFDVPNDPGIRLFWNDMITATPRQLVCQTTDTVTGWINSFHVWGGAGNLLLPHLSVQSDGNDTVHVDNISYPWRKTTELPTAYTDIRSCMSGDAPWGAHDHIMVGMMAKSITKGIPDGYKQAMQMAGLTLPANVGDSHHSILQPEPIWIIHFEEGSSPGPCCSPENRAPCDLIITTDGLGQPFDDGTF